MIDLSDKNIVGPFYETLESEFNNSWASKIGWLNSSSDRETELYRWLGNVPQMREWIGARQSKGLNAFEYSLKNKIFESTLEFDVEDLRRDKTGQIQIRIGELAQRTQTHWNKLTSDLIIANPLAFDGVALFGSHTFGTSTINTAPTSTQIPSLDVATATAPTAIEAAAIIQGMVGYFLSFTDDVGEPLNGEAKQFQIQVGTVNLYTAFQTALKVTQLSQGMTNPVSVALPDGVQIEVVLNVRLAAQTTKVYMFRTDAKLKAIILQEESGVQTSIIGAGSEEEFKNNRHLFGCKAVRNVGAGIFYYGIQGTLS